MTRSARFEVLFLVLIGVLIGVLIILLFGDALRCLSPSACEAGNPKAALIR